MTKRDIDAQFIGGDYRSARLLIKDFPALRERWSYDELAEMVRLLIDYELDGKKGIPSLIKYMDIRGVVGALKHCRDYRTDEYCVMLTLLRRLEYNAKARQRRLERGSKG